MIKKSRQQNFKTTYGAWALITGASSGIGEAFAYHLARLGLNVILVARRKDRLIDISRQLIKKYQIECIVICSDLSTDNFIEPIIQQTANLDIGLIINNAGTGQFGYFSETSLRQAVDILHLNCRAPLVLTHHFANKMKPRKKGGIIFVASIAGFIGVSRMSHYAATKAYNLLLAEGLYHELKTDNIDVLALCPGVTKTEFQQKANIRTFLPMSPEAVVAKALKNLGQCPTVVPGYLNQLAGGLIKVLPRAWGNKVTDIGGNFF